MWGVSYMAKIRSVLIKYKFSFEENTAHSSYLYQKVFRSIYGYNQNVTKKSTKIYNYFRTGVVSNTPYIKSGKNSLILPIGYETELIEYFETGKNPTHNWKNKGNWTVEYKKDFIDIDSETITKTLGNYINTLKMVNESNKQVNFMEELNLILSKDNSNQNYITTILNIMKKIINTNWFNETNKLSSDLSKFYEIYNKLKVKYNI